MDLGLIDTHAGTQTRATIDMSVVSGYAEDMLRGDVFPPIVVFKCNGQYILADGFHRLRAARKAHRKIKVSVRNGSRTDALKFALVANRAHGLRMSSADKRHCVRLALHEWPTWSDRAVAQACGVSHTFVANMRGQLATVASCKKRVGRDGKRRKVAISVKQEHVETIDIEPVLRKLADALQAVKKAMEKHPSQRSLLADFLKKYRSDLGNILKHLAA